MSPDQKAAKPPSAAEETPADSESAPPAPDKADTAKPAASDKPDTIQQSAPESAAQPEAESERKPHASPAVRKFARELGVDEDRQRDVRLVRIARVVLHVHGAEADRLVDLIGGDPGAVRVDHRLDEVVDEALDLGREELLLRQDPRRLAEDRVADRRDFPDGHARSQA